MEKTMTLTANVARKYGAKVVALAGAALVSAQAMALNESTGVASVNQLKTEMGDYSGAMFGLAVVSVGIMIGVKWIKRARGAA